MTNVLIIGGNRFLGKTIAEAFLQDGAYRVFELNRGTRPPNRGIAEQFRCDKNDRAEFGRILTSRSWDIVIDTILKDNDLEFAIDALTGCVGHFIHTGSIGVYGDARRIPAPEWLPMAQGGSFRRDRIQRQNRAGSGIDARFSGEELPCDNPADEQYLRARRYSARRVGRQKPAFLPDDSGGRDDSSAGKRISEISHPVCRRFPHRSGRTPPFKGHGSGTSVFAGRRNTVRFCGISRGTFSIRTIPIMPSAPEICLPVRPTWKCFRRSAGCIWKAS